MIITTRMALEIAAHEAVVRQAYKDSTGRWTWSVGITSASGHPVEQYIDNPQPLRHCIAVWLDVLEQYADDVADAFAGHDLTEAQFAAALSFHWNTGAIGSAAWVKHWKAGNRRLARKAFMNWRRPPEIISRREAERDLFFDGVWTNDGSITEYTKLTRNYTPVWSSATRRDVSGVISAILDAPEPEPEPEPAPSLWAQIIAALRGFIERMRA